MYISNVILIYNIRGILINSLGIACHSALHSGKKKKKKVQTSQKLRHLRKKLEAQMTLLLNLSPITDKLFSTLR